MTTKRKILKFFLIFIIVIFILFVTVIGYFTLFNYYYIDSPCIIIYYEQNNCIRTINRPGPSPIIYLLEEDFANAKIESFLDKYEIMASGAGCNYAKTKTNFLEVGSPPLKVQLERVDDRLRVNNKLLEKGEEFQVTDIFFLHPWGVHKLIIKNLGLVDICDLNEALEKFKDEYEIDKHSIKVEPRIVVIGEHGTYFSPIKGLIILIIFILALNKAIKIK